MNAATNDGLTGGSAALRKSDFTQLESQKWLERTGWQGCRERPPTLVRAGRRGIRFHKPIILVFVFDSDSFYNVWQGGVLIEKMIGINLLWSVLQEKQSLSSASDGIFILLV